MNADAIREMLQREPFQPFVIHLSSGESHEVRHPECLAIGKGRIAITDPDADRVAICSLMHVTSIEFLQPT
ncbi:MAG: hypothetical protein ACKO1M_01445 [Planctomycetota bacterium]